MSHQKESKNESKIWASKNLNNTIYSACPSPHSQVTYSSFVRKEENKSLELVYNTHLHYLIPHYTDTELIIIVSNSHHGESHYDQS